MMVTLPTALSDVPTASAAAPASVSAAVPAASAAAAGFGAGTGAASTNALPVAFGEVMAGLRSAVKTGVSGLALAGVPSAILTVDGLPVAISAGATAAHALASSSTAGEDDGSADDAGDGDKSPDALATMSEAKHAAMLGMMGLLSEASDPAAVFAPPATKSLAIPLPPLAGASTAAAATLGVAGNAQQMSSMLGMSISAQQAARATDATATAQPAIAGAGPEVKDAALPSASTSAALVAALTPSPSAAAIAGSGQANDAAAPLTAMLGERIQLQQQHGVQQAVVNLQPHLAGDIRIEVVHDAGALRVHLSASNDEVVRQLQTVGENLRQELASRQFTDVSVHIAQQRSQDGQGQGRNAQENAAAPSPSRALGDDDVVYDSFASALRRLTASGIISS
jgi:flagellar hook-length control protein FliK